MDFFLRYVWANTKQTWVLLVLFLQLALPHGWDTNTHKAVQLLSVALTGIWLKMWMQICIYLKLFAST